MPSVTTEVRHELSVTQAVERVKGLMTRLRGRHQGRLRDVAESWGATRGDVSFALSGLRIKGTVDVLDGVVRARIEIPFAALVFRSTIENAIRQELVASLA